MVYTRKHSSRKNFRDVVKSAKFAKICHDTVLQTPMWWKGVPEPLEPP